MNKKIYISKSKISGKGIFARKNIKRNEIVFITKGKVFKGKYEKDNYVYLSNAIGIDKNVWLVINKNNPVVFLNHSCEPNLGIKGKVTFVAMRNIKKGEELTFDYSITEDDPYWKMKCSCGSKRCRKIIKSARFLTKDLFNEYKNYMPRFAKQSYLENNKS